MTRGPAVSRGIYGLLAAQAISQTGSRMTMLALPWFVLVTTHSAGMTGVVAFAEMAPYVLACALGGPLLDRVGVRRASILCDAGSFVAFAAIPMLGQSAALIAVVALAGVLRGLGDTGKRVLFPRTVKAAGMDLTRGAALGDGVHRLATLLGAPLGGVLIAALDAQSVILIDAATFAAGAVLVAVLVPGTGPSAGGQPQAHEPYLSALKAGVAFLRRERLAAALLLFFFATNLFDAAYGSVLIPAWAQQLGSSVVLGMVSGSFALGAVLGNIAFTALAPRLPRYAVFVAGFLVGGAPRYIAVALTDQLWIIYAISFAAGLGIAAINPISSAIFYERVPEQMMARVQGIGTALGWAGIPLGALLGGLSAQGMGVSPALVLFGVLYLIVTVQPLIWPAWKQIDVRPAPPRVEPSPRRDPTGQSTLPGGAVDADQLPGGAHPGAAAQFGDAPVGRAQ